MSFIASNKLICSDTVGYRMCLKHKISQDQSLSNASLCRHLIPETEICRISLALVNRSIVKCIQFTNNLIITLHVGIEIRTLVFEINTFILEINTLGMGIVKHNFET